MKKRSYAIAFSSVMTALCIILLFLGSVVTVLDLSCAALASMVIILAVIEIGGFYPWLIWLCTSILGLLLLPDKFGSLVFFLFAGYYPILKSFTERLPKAFYFIKLIVFNLSLTLIIFSSKALLGLPDTEITYSVFTYLICNIVFVLYDIAMTRLITLYLFKLRRRFKFFK